MVSLVVFIMATLEIVLSQKKLLDGRNGPFGDNVFKIRLDYFLFYSFVTSSLPCRKDQFAVLYFLQVIIILIQVYNQEIRRHSMVCYCGLAGIYSTAIRPGFETVSKQHSAYAQQTSYSIKYRLFLESAKIEQGKERIC